MPFLRAVLATKVRAVEQWPPTAQQKPYLQHQGEFQHKNCTAGSLHDSDHDGVVRIFVGHSLVVNINYLVYITRHNFFPTRSVTYALVCSLFTCRYQLKCLFYTGDGIILYLSQRIPAVCRPPWHLVRPMSHHTRYPKFHFCRSPLALHRV